MLRLLKKSVMLQFHEGFFQVEVKGRREKGRVGKEGKGRKD